MESKTFIFEILGENLSELVGPNKTIIGTLASEIMCITPLSIEMALSNLFDNAVTRTGEECEVSFSGKIALGTECLIFFNKFVHY